MSVPTVSEVDAIGRDSSRRSKHRSTPPSIPDAVRAAVLPLVLPGAWLRIRARIARLIGRPMPAGIAIDALVNAIRRGNASRGQRPCVLFSSRFPRQPSRTGAEPVTMSCRR
jgi:hypothetical protein